MSLKAEIKSIFFHGPPTYVNQEIFDVIVNHPMIVEEIPDKKEREEFIGNYFKVTNGTSTS